MAMTGTVIKANKLTLLQRRLLDVIETFELSPEETNPNRWLAGVTWQPLPCRPILIQGDVDPCDPDDSTNPAYTCQAAVSQSAFRLYDAYGAATLEHTAAELEELLGEHFPAFKSAAFATELIGGAAGSTMSLSSEAHAPAGVAFGSAASVSWNALAVLEADLASTIGNAQGFIHLPPGLLSQTVDHYGVHLVGDHWETPLGNVVISEAGYINPAAPDGEDAAGAAEDWVYASGPVTYRDTEMMFVGNRSESTDIATNDLLRWMEMYGILVFDPCPVTAILTSYDLGGLV